MRSRYSQWDGSQDPFGPDVPAAELLEEMSEDLLSGAGAQVRSTAAGMRKLSPETLQRCRDMVAELKRMLEQRDRGESHDFDWLMQRFWDLCPDNPKTLDELLESMARRMAARSRLLASL